MSIISFPFLSRDGDRKVLYTAFRSLFHAYFTNGVFLTSGENNIQAVSKNGMTVTVKAGKCNINGVFCEIDSDVDVTLDSAGSYARTDRIVLRLNDNEESRNVSVVVLKGNPNAVALTRTGAIYDLCIAEVSIGTGVSSISNSNINDTRLDTELCGIVASTIKEFDTETLYNQIQTDLQEFKNNEKANFEEWYAGIQDQLSGDIAGNLQNQITQLSNQMHDYLRE
ncbi:hypothetical protein ACR75P_08225 [Faecalicoccus pleomorphus]|uniref:hypothetical protein n=1 Tax=Faecalicoccus pleomorphus TaxID=1323 RepID=UPI003DA6C793